MAQRKVTAIPATITKYTAVPIGSKRKRRVAGYARVSTDHEDQVTSYEAQVDYYTNYIKGRDDWEFVAIYTDEGISATNTKRREGFKAMVADALAGKIDLIVTKSVSRFARNTVDSLTTVRTLKEKGVEIYFEKENIWTLDARENCSSQSCPALPRRRAGAFRRTPPGVSGSGSPMARQAWLTSGSWGTTGVPTAALWSIRNRQRPSS